MKDYSFGVIPVFKASSVEPVFLLIRHSKDDENHWSFPKGHKNPGESDIETARRELTEETGLIDIEINDSVHFTENYSIQKENQKIDREVIYFPGFTDQTRNKIPDEFKDEIAELAWLPYDEAMSRLTFIEAKDALKKTKKWLDSPEGQKFIARKKYCRYKQYATRSGA